MAPTLTQCNVVQYITRQYRTIYRIQYNTIRYNLYGNNCDQEWHLQVGMMVGRFCCWGVTVTTSLSQHYGPVWRRNYFRQYLPLHSIFLKSSSATASREVTITTSLSQRYGPVWRRNYFRQYLPFQLLSSWNHRLLPPTYQKVTVTTSLSRWWLCVTSQCI